MRRSAVAISISTAFSLLAADAHAWNSTCSNYESNDVRVADLRPSRGCCQGPDSTRGRFRTADHQDEHSQIFRDAVAAAGVPQDVLETASVRVYTNASTVSSWYVSAIEPSCATIGSQPTLTPVGFDFAQRVRLRSFSVDELAMLPDFSFSLWDWASGNETCPLRGFESDGPIDCHTGRTHMGHANANHFPPMSDRYFARLHAMAVTRARECGAMRMRVPAAQQARFTEYWRQCETEALAIEAYAQHYMQDSFSSGHMWERWGATDIDRFPVNPPSYFTGFPNALTRQRQTAIAVGLTAGMIHGVEPVLGDTYPDALCHPYPDVNFVLGGVPVPGAGDTHYFAQMRARTDGLDPAQQRLLDCASAGVRQVYEAFVPMGASFTAAHGALVAGSSGSMTRDPLGVECRDLRATNAAMYHGMGVDGTTVGTVHFDDALASVVGSPLWVAQSTPVVGAIPASSLSTVGTILYNRDLVRMTALARIRAADPRGQWDTDVASMNIDDGSGFTEISLLNTRRNSHYTDHLDDGGPLSQQASYQDPDLPWAGAPTRGDMIARTFNRAHVQEYCARTDMALLDRLRVAATAISDPETDAAQCDACAEITARHLRVGTSSSYDTTAEPVCSFFGSTTFVYQRAVSNLTNVRSLARVWCGCPQRAAALTDAGLRQVEVSGATVRESAVGALRLASLPRDVATTSDLRAVISHGDGTIVFADLDRAMELDTDNNAMTTSAGAPSGVTRINVGSGARGVSIIERAGEAFALITVGGSDEVVVLRLGTKLDPRTTVCERFNVGRDSMRNEDAWDILLLPNGLKGYVSFRGLGTNLGNAIAILNIPNATDCMPNSGEVTGHMAGVFGAPAGLGAMSLSPDGRRFLVTMRRQAGCTVPIRNAANSGTIDAVVGCDSVGVVDTMTDAIVPVPGTIPYLRSMPTFFPYAVAWFPDGQNVAWAEFGDPGSWPQAQPLTGGGAVRLGNTTTGLHSYHAALRGNVAGESLLINTAGDFVFVGTMSGAIYALPGLSASNTFDPFWTDFDADPENALHGLPMWYGGCRVASGRCVAGWCPTTCDSNVRLNLGSPIRALVAF